MTGVSRRVEGLAWCFVFVILDAAQAVYFGGVLQRFDGFLLGGVVFGLAAGSCVLWTASRRPEQLILARAHARPVLGLNVTAAFAWLLYLAAIQLIEPAIAFTLFAGIIPAVTIIAAALGVPEGQWPRNRAEWIGNAVVAVGLVYLVVITLAGLSGFVRGGPTVAMAGSGLALLGGVFITGMLLYGQRLDRIGLEPVTQFGLRFPLFLILSAAAVALGIDRKPAVGLDEWAVAVAVGLVVLAFPIYAVQKAVSLSPALTVGAVAATAPLFVYLFQRIEGRVELSGATGLGLAVFFAGAVIAAAGASLAPGKER